MGLLNTKRIEFILGHFSVIFDHWIFGVTMRRIPAGEQKAQLAFYNKRRLRVQLKIHFRLLNMVFQASQPIYATFAHIPH